MLGGLSVRRSALALPAGRPRTRSGGAGLTRRWPAAPGPAARRLATRRLIASRPRRFTYTAGPGNSSPQYVTPGPFGIKIFWAERAVVLVPGQAGCKRDRNG